MESDEIGIYAQAELLGWAGLEQGKIKTMILSLNCTYKSLIYNDFYFRAPRVGGRR